jgi:hypothetical protein
MRIFLYMKNKSYLLKILFAAIFVLTVFAHPTLTYAQVGTCGGVANRGMYRDPNDGSCSQATLQCTSGQRVVSGAPIPHFCNVDYGYFTDANENCSSNDQTCSNPPATITSFSANGSSIYRGNSSVLSWASSNATACTITNASSGATIYNGRPNDSTTVSPLTTTSYGIQCSNSIGNISYGNGVTVNVNPPPFIATCSPNKTSAIVGEPVTWSASASNGTQPYSFNWIGQIVSGLTGTPITVNYQTTGTKTVSVQVTDSSSNGGGLAISKGENDMCAGGLAYEFMPGGYQVEDGGYASEMQAATRDILNTAFNDPEDYTFFNHGATANYWYNQLRTNPQNYCVAVRLGRRCIPTQTAWEGCNWSFVGGIYYGTAKRGLLPPGDLPTAYPYQGYSATGIGSIASGQPLTTTAACTASVTVNAPAQPSVTFTADPTSIVAGSQSQLQWSASNVTSCSIDNGVGGVSSSGGTTSVSPGSTTTYIITCNGATGTTPATAQATVSVTPRLTATCSVSPNPGTAGQAETYTANTSGGTGTNTYSWSGDGISGSTRTINPVYSTPGSKNPMVIVSSGGQTATASCGTVYIRPAPPTLNASQCTNRNTQVTLSWNSPAGGADNYYWRVGDASGNLINGANTTGTSINYSPVTPGQTYTWWVHSNTGPASPIDSNRYSDAASSSFTCAALPDLTASGITPTTAVVGTPTVLSATISNNSPVSTGRAFSSLFQIATDVNGSNAQDIGSFGNTTIGANQSQPAYLQNPGYTFPSVGTYYVRACADKVNAGDGGVITESDETNNCGAWTPITVDYAKPASPTNLQASCSLDGTSVTLSWNPSTSPAVTNYYVRLYDGITPAGPSNLNHSGYKGYSDGYTGTSIVYGITPGQNYDWWVHSNIGPADYNPNHYSDPAGAPQLNCPGLPDLTAADATPVTVVRGTSYTFNGTAKNTGLGPSGGSGFRNVFQVCDGSAASQTASGNCSSYNVVNDMWLNGNVPTNSTSPLSFTWSVPSNLALSGTSVHTSRLAQIIEKVFGIKLSHAATSTYYYRWCANYNSSWTTTVAESNYGNNCGAWGAMTVTDPTVMCSAAQNSISIPPDKQVTYTVNPGTGAVGDYTWLSSDGWTTTTASKTMQRRYSLDDPTYPVPPAGGTYQMRVKGSNTAYAVCSPDTVVTTPYCAGPGTLTLTASPSRVVAGGSVTLSWSGSNIGDKTPSCSIKNTRTNTDVKTIQAPSASPSCSITSDSSTVTINQQETFAISCTDGSSKTITVNVVPKPNEF